MADKTKVAEQYYAPPPDLGKWESFRIFLWNSETGQFLGRTGSSWGEFYIFLIWSYDRFPSLFGGKIDRRGLENWWRKILFAGHFLLWVMKKLCKVGL